jgi:hypothetical protein
MSHRTSRSTVREKLAVSAVLILVDACCMVKTKKRIFQNEKQKGPLGLLCKSRWPSRLPSGRPTASLSHDQYGRFLNRELLSPFLRFSSALLRFSVIDLFVCLHSWIPRPQPSSSHIISASNSHTCCLVSSLTVCFQCPTSPATALTRRS